MCVCDNVLLFIFVFGKIERVRNENRWRSVSCSKLLYTLAACVCAAVKVQGVCLLYILRQLYTKLSERRNEFTPQKLSSNIRNKTILYNVKTIYFLC